MERCVLSQGELRSSVVVIGHGVLVWGPALHDLLARGLPRSQSKCSRAPLGLEELEVLEETATWQQPDWAQEQTQAALQLTAGEGRGDQRPLKH